MTEFDLQATQYRRIVTLDIETVTLDSNVAKGALDALTGRVVCVGLLLDDGAQLSEVAIADEDEEQILIKFWSSIRPADTLVGFNLIEFDLPFLKRRSWILGVQPSRTFDLRRFYSSHMDVMQLWTNWSFRKFVSLDALAAALDCGQKSAHGEDVATMWANGDLEAIRKYCMEDVRITYRLYCKMMYLPPRIFDPEQRPRMSVFAGRLRHDPVLFPNKAPIQSAHHAEAGSSVLPGRRRKKK